MASNIKGITVEIGGDTTKLSSALSGVNKQSKDLQSELTAVNKLLKLDPSNTELLSQKQNILKESINSTKEKLEQLKSVQDQVKNQFANGEIDEGAYRAFQRELITTKQKLKDLTEESKTFGNVFTQQIANAGNKVQELGGKIEAAGKGFSAVSGVATAGLVASAKGALDTETAVNKYVATTGKAVTETDKYKELMESIYQNNYGESIGDVADKMTLVSNVMGDLPDDQLQNIVEKSYMLQDAYDMDTQESLRAVKMLMNQFGISADEAYNLIVQGTQKGLNKNGDFLDSLNEYGVHYKQLGMDADEFITSLILGTENGAFSVDKVGDAMKEFGIRVKDNSDSTRQAFKDLGLNADSMTKAFGKGGESAKGAMNKVMGALIDLEDPIKRNEVGVALFGTMWEDLGEDVLNGATSVDGYTDSILEAEDASKKLNDTMYSGTANKAQEAMRNIQVAFSRIGEVLVTTFAPLVEKVAELAEKFSNLSPVTQKIILIITGLVASIAPILIIIGKVISAVGQIMTLAPKLVPLINGIKSAITGLFGLISAHPIIAIITAIIGIVILLYTKCEWFRDGVHAILDAIVNFFKAAWEFIKSIWEGLPDFFSGLWEGIKTVFSVVGSVIGGFFSGAWNIVKSIWNGAVTFFKTLWNGIKAVFSVVKTVLSGFFTNAWNGIKAVWNSVIAFFRNIWNGIKAVFSTVTIWFKSIFSSAWSGIKSVFSNVGSFFKGVISKIKNTFNDLPSKMKSIGKDVINGLVNGIKSKVSAVTNAIKDVTGKITGKVKSILGIKSPSRVMAQYGEYTTEGLAVGIKNKANLASDAMSSVVDDVIAQTDQSTLLKLGVNTNNVPTSQVVNKGDTIVNFNGNYQFKNRDDIDYFMNEAGLRLVGVR